MWALGSVGHFDFQEAGKGRRKFQVTIISSDLSRNWYIETPKTSLEGFSSWNVQLTQSSLILKYELEVQICESRTLNW